MSTVIDSLELKLESEFSGAKKGILDALSGMKELEDTIVKLQSVNSTGFDRVQKSVEDLGASFKRTSAEAKNTKFDFNMSDIYKVETEVENLMSRLRDISSEYSKALVTNPDDTEGLLVLAMDAAEAVSKINDARKELARFGTDIHEVLTGIPQIPKTIDESLGIDQTIAKTDTLKNRLNNVFERFRVPTAEFEKIQKEMDAIAKKYEDTMGKIEKNFGIFGEAYGSTDQFRKQLADIGELQHAYAELNEQKELLMDAGEAYASGNGVAVVGVIIKKALSEASNAIRTFLGGLRSASGKVIDLAKAFDRVAGPVSNLKGRFESLKASTENVATSFGRVGKMLRLMLMRMALRGVIDGVKTGMGNLAHYCETTRASMNNLINGLGQLKNAFVVAFSPIWSVIAPAVNYLISLLSAALNAIGRFFSALTGRSTAVQAVKVNTDNYASALKGVSGGAGKAAKAVKDLTDAQKENLTVLGFDELNQLQKQDDKSGSGGSGGSGGGGGAGIPDYGAMFDTVEIEKPISEFAERIRKAIESHDWNGLGTIIAEGINLGIQKLWNFLQSVQPKLYAFCDAFAQTFNAIVDNVDWEGLGQLVGEGINTLVNSASILLNGIDWTQFGASIAQSLNALFDQVDWKNLGNTLGSWLMTLWNIGYGVVTTLNWGMLGKHIGDAITGFFSKYNFATILGTIANFINGIAKAMLVCIKTTDWNVVVNNIVDGINKFLSTVDVGMVMQAVSSFIITILQALVKIIGNTRWDLVGRALIEGLCNINWLELLKNLAMIIINTLKDLALGLIGGVFGAIKDKFTGGGDSSAVKDSGKASAVDYATGFADAVPQASAMVSGASQQIMLAGVNAGVGFGTQYGTMFYDEATNSFISGSANAQTALTTQLDQIKTAGITSASTCSEIGTEMSNNVVNGLTDGFTANSARVSSSVGGLITDIGTKSTDFSASGTTGGASYNKSLSDEIRKGGNQVNASISALNKSIDKSMGDMSKISDKNATEAMKAFADGIKKSESAIVQNITQILNRIQTTFKANKSKFSSAGSDLASSFQNGFSGRSTSISNAASSIANSVLAQFTSYSFKSSMTSAGQSAGQAFANGIKAVKIPVPHLEISSYTNTKTGNTTVSTPNYKVNWYGKGGYFSDARLIGVGEKGDEAVLPLENKRAMSNIADAIVSGMNSFGGNSDDMRDAVAEGVAMALMNNAGNLFNPNLYVTVKTESDEVLARAVQRGQSRLDYRMNVRRSY